MFSILCIWCCIGFGHILHTTEQLADSPKTVVIPKPNPNKWEGEDEDDVKVIS